MNHLTLTSYAKVNLTLDVLGRRPEDGYHYIRTVMVPISLADRVDLYTAPAGVQVVCEPDIAGPAERNLAYRAAVLLKEVTGHQGGVEIRIEKRIPVAGGLAGGSTNAGAVLAGLNRLWGTGLTEADLIGLAMRLGSDVPFFVPARPARVEGVGEVLTPISMKQPLWLVLATPDVPKSTGNVYRLYDDLTQVRHIDASAMERALHGGDLEQVAGALGNVFEDVMLPLHPEIAAVRQELLNRGAVGALMSGAGPTVFGIAADESEGRRLLAAVQPLAPRSFLVRTILEGEQGE